MPAEWASSTVARQLDDPGSILMFYRRAIELRRSRVEFAGIGIEWLDELAFRRPGGLVCALNTGPEPIALPAGTVLLASGELVDGMLGPDTAVWLV
jgi:alpha-glucosidase